MTSIYLFEVMARLYAKILQVYVYVSNVVSKDTI